MGLDQTAYRKSDGEYHEIMTWRKHNALEGFMQNLWQEKGRPTEDGIDIDPTIPASEAFNRVLLELTAEDINMLEEAVNADELPVTSGFFFGPDSSRDAFKYECTVKFIKLARKALSKGEQVFYTSDW
jgi:hypothetical protein